MVEFILKQKAYHLQSFLSHTLVFNIAYRLNPQYILGQKDLGYSLALVHLIPSWLVWAENECNTVKKLALV